jgi:hypothetical protein
VKGIDMDWEETLGALSAAPGHPGLDGLDAAVFARIDAEARALRSARHGMLAVVGAATLAGMAAAALPGGRAADGAGPLLPSALAPSTLLAGDR